MDTAMKTKQPSVAHTPGPWTSDASANYVFAYSGQMMVCEVRGWGYLTGRLRLPEEQAMAIQSANANLLEAAPDLLAALEALYPLVEFHEDEGPAGEGWRSDKLLAILKQAQEAMSRARGR